ncbi:MAG: hypothetical protein JWM81_664 [Candidatus Saccharibacteria bacterium]|nr:hypothetical protein [Candidatus Saccharibacteria bacterium]
MPHETPPQAPQPDDPWNQAPISMHEHLSSVYETQNDIDHLVLETRQKPAEAEKNGHGEAVQAEARQAVEHAYAQQANTDKLVSQAEELFASVASTNIQNVRDRLPASTRKGNRRAERPADATGPQATEPELNLPVLVPSKPGRKGNRRATRPADASNLLPVVAEPNLPVPLPPAPIEVPAPPTPPEQPPAPERPQEPAQPEQPEQPEHDITAENSGEHLIDRISYTVLEAENGNSQLVINEGKRIYSVINGHGRGDAPTESATIAGDVLDAVFKGDHRYFRPDQFRQAYEMAAAKVQDAVNIRKIKDHAHAGISGASVQFYNDEYGHLHATYAQLGSGTMFRERTVVRRGKSYSEITMLSDYRFENRIGPNYSPGAWSAAFTDELLEGDRIIIADRNLFPRFVDKAQQIKALTPLVATEDMHELLYNLEGKNPGVDQSIIVIDIGKKPDKTVKVEEGPTPLKRPGRIKRVTERIRARDRARYNLDDDHFGDPETPETPDDEPGEETEGRQSRAARLAGKIALRGQRRSRYAIAEAGRRSSFGMSPNNAQLRFQRLAQADAEARAQAEAEASATVAPEVIEEPIEEPQMPFVPSDQFRAPYDGRLVGGFDTEEDPEHPKGKIGAASSRLRASGAKASRRAATSIKRGVQKRVQERVEKSRADSSR